MLVLPMDVLLLELFNSLWLWRWLGDFGDKVRCGSFGDAINEHTEKRNLEERDKGECKAEEHTFSIAKPLLLLFGRIANS